MSTIHDVSDLNPDQRRLLASQLRNVQEMVKDWKKANESERKLKVDKDELQHKVHEREDENAVLQLKNEELEEMCESLKVANKTEAAKKTKLKSAGIKEGYMPINTFRTQLKNAGLLREEADQDVYHIIANANGGPDHTTDNYLYALGSTFNRYHISDKFDHFNCLIADKVVAKKAVDISRETAELINKKGPDHMIKSASGQMEKIGKFVPKRKRAGPDAVWLYTNGPHKYKTGGIIYAEGEAWFRQCKGPAGTELKISVRSSPLSVGAGLTYHHSLFSILSMSAI